MRGTRAARRLTGSAAFFFFEALLFFVVGVVNGVGIAVDVSLGAAADGASFSLFFLVEAEEGAGGMMTSILLPLAVVTIRGVDEQQSQRNLTVRNVVTPAKRQKVGRRNNRPTCVSWTSPSKVRGTENRRNMRELIRSKNWRGMDRQGY